MTFSRRLESVLIRDGKARATLQVSHPSQPQILTTFVRARDKRKDRSCLNSKVKFAQQEDIWVLTYESIKNKSNRLALTP